MQKKSIRIITNSAFLAHTDKLFKSTRILKVEDLFNLKQLLFYKKLLQGTLPTSVSSIINRQNYNLRSCHSYLFLQHPISTRTESAKLCIRHSIPKFINGFDFNFISNLKEISVHTVESRYKQIILSSYSDDCLIPNCFVCNRNP